jgi:hypothetical protein
MEKNSQIQLEESPEKSESQLLNEEIRSEENKDTDKSDSKDNHKNDPDAIGFLTYNMFMRPPPAKTNESDFKDARLAHFA